MNSNEEMNNLKRINSMLGYTISRLNVCYDEKDAEFFNEILTARIKDIPKIYIKAFNKLIEEMPEEFKKMHLCELIDEMNIDIFG